MGENQSQISNVCLTFFEPRTSKKKLNKNDTPNATLDGLMFIYTPN